MYTLINRLIALIWDGALPIPRPLLRSLAYYAVPSITASAMLLSVVADPTLRALHGLGKGYGNLAILLMLVIMFVSPAVRILPTVGFLRLIMSYRREMGVMTGWIVLFHFLGLGYALGFLSADSIMSIFSPTNSMIFAGTLSALGIAALALTSNNASLRALGRNWRRLHMLAYPAFFFALAHQFLRPTHSGGSQLTMAFVMFGVYLVAKFVASRGWHITIPRPSTISA